MRESYVVVIPIFNHAETIKTVVQDILARNLSCIIVNDGSDEKCSSVLCEIQRTYPNQVFLQEHCQNMGKGAAVITGMRYAAHMGFTHVMQVDADGQHNLKDVALLIELSQKKPHALITGVPIYDNSVPRLRLYLRYLTHVWVWINTLSFSIKDSMCGFRVYPLKMILPILDQYHFLPRMSFDIEILVRSYWHKVEILSVPTHVHYPLHGKSHFKLLLDNWQITLTHAKLFVVMNKAVLKSFLHKMFNH